MAEVSKRKRINHAKRGTYRSGAGMNTGAHGESAARMRSAVRSRPVCSADTMMRVSV